MSKKSKSRVRTRKRGNTYSYSFEAGKDPITGKRKPVEKGGFATEDEAYDAGVAAYVKWKGGAIAVASDDILLKDYLVHWLNEISKPQTKKNTYNAYAYYVDKIILYIGNITLQDLKARDCARLLNHLVDDEDLHRSTIKSIKNCLANALKYAVFPAELITTNAAKDIPIPRHARTESKIKRIVISRKQVEEIIREHPFGDWAYLPILVAYRTGMRPSEVIGLEWSSVDLDGGTIHIEQGQCFSRLARRPYIDTPKTLDSDRVVLIDKFLLGELRRWKKRQSKNRIDARAAYQNVFTEKEGYIFSQSVNLPCPAGATQRDFICTDEKGYVVTYAMLSGIVRRKYDLNMHSFRHTHATKLIEAGAKPVAVAARLGHKDATITQNLYTHETEVMRKETLEIFEKSLL